MPGQSTRVEQAAKTAGDNRTKRLARAQRILDAAAELIQRWGYKKTTVEDIARQAGVAKGTIYLHWKTREDLFEALLLRESVAMLKALQAAIASDPEGVYISHITQHTMRLILLHPLIRAVFLQDTEVLGELIQSNHGDLHFLSSQKMVLSDQLMTFYRAKGMLRADRSVTEQIKLYSALVIGFLTVNQYLPANMQMTPEEATRLLSESIRTILEADEPVASETLQEIRAVWDLYTQQLLQATEERLQKQLD